MRYHGVHLLHLAVKLEGHTTLFVVAVAGFFMFVLPLLGVLIGVFLEYFTLLRRVPRVMHQACFVTSHMIAQMACMVFLVLDSADLLRVGC